MFSIVLEALLSSFGESLTYKGSGALTHAFVGVFDETFVMLDPDSGERVSSDSVSVLLRLSDLPDFPDERKEFDIRGKRYLARRVEKDGQGGARVFLMEK